MTTVADENILARLSDSSLASLEKIEQFTSIDSTNKYLLGQVVPEAGRVRVAVAEQQTAGRGRHGRTWQSPPAIGVYLSLAYTFRYAPRNLPPLSLAIGVGIVRSLQQLGIRGLGLKWPNDIVACNGKVGGILSEVITGRKNLPSVVVGIGLNVDFDLISDHLNISSSIGKATDLKCCCDALPDRAALVSALVDGGFAALREYDQHGITSFIESWQAIDWLRGQRVTVDGQDGLVTGMAEGIGDDGALLIRTKEESRRIVSGSVRLAG